MLTVDLLTRISKACGGTPKRAVVQGIVDNQHFLFQGGIDTVDELAEWCGQALVETDYFKTLREYASGQAYEGRADLGNVKKGDGKRYPGRGVFQLTGRANYRDFGKMIGIDLEAEPERAEEPAISMQTSVLYWNKKGLSPYAAKRDTKSISRAINRGNPRATKPANHEADRIKAANMARDILSKTMGRPVGLMSQSEPEPVEIEDEPVGKLYTDEHRVSLVQTWLRNLGYPEVGAPNGELGPFTKGAIRDYRAEHDLPPGDFIDDELMLTLATDTEPRKLPDSRTEATAAEVRERVPEAQGNWLGKVWTRITAAGSFVVAAASAAWDKLGDAREYLEPIRDFVGDVPTWVWFVAVAGAAFMLSRKFAQGEQASITAFKTGARR